ncbi:conserved protein of unknown function [Acidithiobacillus ferrivorans]|uniref:Uncharacterized protein n=1 Tax=Acidithiobacillus ferrivorans TaxID=160808 RepID=A0A060UIP1_9PROT|nr:MULTISPECIES: hypothetical protein [Acidithiobacillus]MBU2786285.1 hypothetical protein [Acidithiobacillus ferriphilus]MBU2811764.1 hypothetical protein [Acidithiobacillus thiooxidans]MBU2833453.1 hypothetical protein [Acidithiobacillus ferriphilus]OYV81308.1 MAG: hypothetical protein B7Z70_05965 [Acidithiobacillus ferrivorans]CDQ08582.1 conserved hypothetical protein [Acidithiobacillus ferrivorans]
MQNKDFFPDPKEKLDASDDFASFLQAEGGGDLAPLSRAPIQGAVKIAFWGLRLYIVAMLILVTIGFTRGMH